VVVDVIDDIVVVLICCCWLLCCVIYYCVIVIYCLYCIVVIVICCYLLCCSVILIPALLLAVRRALPPWRCPFAGVFRWLAVPANRVRHARNACRRLRRWRASAGWYCAGRLAVRRCMLYDLGWPLPPLHLSCSSDLENEAGQHGGRHLEHAEGLRGKQAVYGQTVVRYLFI